MTDLINNAEQASGGVEVAEEVEYESSEVDPLDHALDEALSKLEETDLNSTSQGEVGKSKEDGLGTKTPGTDSSVEPPIYWSPDMKQVFPKLERPVQEYIAQRERELETKYRQEAGKAAQIDKYHRPFKEVIDSHADYLKSVGVDPAEYFSQLIQGDLYIRNNPREAMLKIARATNIDPSELGELEAEVSSPAYSTMISRLDRIEQMFSKQAQAPIKSQADELEPYKVQIQKEIEGWAQEKDATGNPVRPFFNDLQQDIYSLIGFVSAKNPDATPLEIIDRAYKIALNDRPELVSMSKEREQLDRQRKITEAKEKALLAKKSAVSVSGAPNGRVVGRNAKLTLDQALDDALSSLS